MHTIIKKIIKKQGQDVITSKILVNCIDDEGGFFDVEKRPYKKILKLIIEEGYSRKLLDIGAWKAEAETLARTFAQRNKLQEDEIIYVFSCLAYGLGWLKITPQIPAEVKKKRQQEAQKKAKEVEAAQKRNEEVIRKNAEEAARKKAEIAEKRAQEAERRAAEAERKAKEAEIARKKTETDAQIKLAEIARKKAEAEARIKAAEVARIKSEKDEADRKAAQKVIGKISNLGIIEYTAECGALIDSAYKEYSTLTVEQKTFVTNYEVLTAAKKDYNKLKKVAEEAQKKEEETKKKKEKRKKESIHRWVFWSIYLITAAITFNRINEWWEWVISIIVFLVFAIGRYFYHSTFDDYFVLLKGPDEEELDAFIKENKSQERIPEKKKPLRQKIPG